MNEAKLSEEYPHGYIDLVGHTGNVIDGKGVQASEFGGSGRSERGR